jgi:hypothetical protein
LKIALKPTMNPITETRQKMRYGYRRTLVRLRMIHGRASSDTINSAVPSTVDSVVCRFTVSLSRGRYSVRSAAEGTSATDRTTSPSTADLPCWVLRSRSERNGSRSSPDRSMPKEELANDTRRTTPIPAAAISTSRRTCAAFTFGAAPSRMAAAKATPKSAATCNRIAPGCGAHPVAIPNPVADRHYGGACWCPTSSRDGRTLAPSA